MQKTLPEYLKLNDKIKCQKFLKNPQKYFTLPYFCILKFLYKWLYLEFLLTFRFKIGASINFPKKVLDLPMALTRVSLCFFSV